MTAPVRHLADIREGHLAAIREHSATIQKARKDSAAAARARRALITELSLAGMTYRQIAAEVGISEPRITQIITGG